MSDSYKTIQLVNGRIQQKTNKNTQFFQLCKSVISTLPQHPLYEGQKSNMSQYMHSWTKGCNKFQSQLKMFYFSNLYFPGLASCGTSLMAITQISLVLPLSMSHILSILCTALHVFLGVPEEPHKSPNPVFSVMPTPLKPLEGSTSQFYCYNHIP